MFSLSFKGPNGQQDSISDLDLSYKLQRCYIPVAGLVIVLVCTVFILYWFKSEEKKVTEIEIRGARYFGNDEILLLSGLMVGQSYSRIALDNAMLKIAKAAIIDSVDWQLNQEVLIITVQERKCVAFVHSRKDGRLVEIDAGLHILSAGQIRCSALPVISGPFRQDEAVFSDVRLRHLVAGWLRLKKAYPMLAERISEIKIAYGGGLHIFLTGSKFRIDMAGYLTAKSIHRLFVGLSYLEKSNLKTGRLDLRSREAIFIP